MYYDEWCELQPGQPFPALSFIPGGIAIDHSGDVYVESGNDRIHVFAPIR